MLVGLTRQQRIELTLQLTFLVVAALAVGAMEWLVYWLAGSTVPYFLQAAHGGQSASGGWAALLGLLIFASAAAAAFRWRGRPELLLAAFTSAYAATLAVLWVASPSIWGPERCTFTPGL
jgi:hypothetical protein